MDNWSDKELNVLNALPRFFIILLYPSNPDKAPIWFTAFWIADICERGIANVLEIKF